MPYNPDTHHRRTIRLQGYDYSLNGAYFVTVVVRQRQSLLGNLASEELVLSPAGLAVETVWKQLPERFPFIELDLFCMMPNHFHGILLFAGENPRRHSLADVMRVFKSLSGIAGNKTVGQTDCPFWQRNYFERIICSQAELDRIRKYILENPIRWAEDEENPNRVIPHR